MKRSGLIRGIQVIADENVPREHGGYFFNQSEWARQLHVAEAEMQADLAHWQNQIAQQCLASMQQAGLYTQQSLAVAAAGGSTREAEQGSDSPCSPPAPLRSTCGCGQEIPPRDADKFTDNLDWPPSDVCADCWGDADRFAFRDLLSAVPIDARIAAARKAEADPTSDWSAWSHPAAEGEAW